jgi:hypothetical protein
MSARRVDPPSDEPPSGEPPLPFCQRCGKQIDQATIGPRVGLGHCPACSVYSCRWCWADALGACPGCGTSFAGADAAGVARDSDRAPTHRWRDVRVSIGVGAVRVVVAVLALAAFLGSPFLGTGEVERAFETPVAVTSASPGPSPGPMWVGVGAGGLSGAADIKGAVNYVRLDVPSSPLVTTYNDAGVAVIAAIVGPYNQGGVSALDANAWAANAVATYRDSPSMVAIEILNEPGRSLFWGPNALSQANASAYANLLKTVHSAFVSAFGADRPSLLASYDGGYSGGPTWGQQVWAADPNVGSYIDGITMHPYGGTGGHSSSALGNRSNVAAAEAATGLPVYITEVGWPTAVGQPATGDSLQWSEADQATNIYNFVTWARGTDYIRAVIVFDYRDSGTNTWYGITRVDGSHKKSYEDLRRAALGLPRSP